MAHPGTAATAAVPIAILHEATTTAQGAIPLREAHHHHAAAEHSVLLPAAAEEAWAEEGPVAEVEAHAAAAADAGAKHIIIKLPHVILDDKIAWGFFIT